MTTIPATTMGVRRPATDGLLSRINWRMVTFLVVMGGLLGVPSYLYVDSVRSGGVRQRADGYTQIDLKAMVSFPFDNTWGTIDDVPERWRAFDGQKVAFRGEMVPAQVATGGVGTFELVYSVSDCCYSGPPQIQHFVQAHLPDGGTVPFYPYPIEVLGTLKVDVVREDGRVRGVFHLDVDRVDPV